MIIVKSADCTEIITVMTKMVTVCVIVALVRLIHMREVRKMTDDTICRAAALDALDRLEYTPGEWATNGLTMCKDAIKALPPASFENHDEIKSYSKDTISRQAAIKNAHFPVIDDASYEVVRVDDILALPSAQPDVPDTNVGDMISRQAAIETVRKAQSIGQAHRMLMQLPSAQQVPWDSGKFPEESGTYTVTAYDGAKRRVTYAKYQKRLKRWELTGARAYWRVLAWMPHIEPWEGGQDGKN